MWTFKCLTPLLYFSWRAKVNLSRFMATVYYWYKRY